jgi:hypothetical protein
MVLRAKNERSKVVIQIMTKAELRGRALTKQGDVDRNCNERQN